MIGARLTALARRLRPRPRILMYHRVAALPRDPWGLAVHPVRFAAHMALLRRARTPLALKEFVARLGDGTLSANAVAVTFDDGYVDNFRHAHPALAAAAIPAALFVVSGAIGKGEPFWWDELTALVLARAEPARITATINDVPIEVRLGAPEPGDYDPSWRAWHPARTARQRAYFSFWERLQSLAPAPQRVAMAGLRAALGPVPSDEGERAMTADELRAITTGGLVTLGGHTANHPELPKLTQDEQRAEIAIGRHAVEALGGVPLAGFAYPYGATSDDTRHLVEAAGFAYACTTDADLPMHRASDRFALPRLAVADVEAAAFARALS